MLAARIARQIRQIAIGSPDSGGSILMTLASKSDSTVATGAAMKLAQSRNLEAFEDAGFHSGIAPVTFGGFVSVPYLLSDPLRES
jgi:hypothetical protein